MELETNTQSNKTTLWIVLGMAVAYMFLILSALFAASRQIREMAIGASTDAAIGPLDLIHIQKIAVHGSGFGLEFSAMAGLFILALIVIVLGLAAVAFKKRKG